jgi:hypothetical protein
VHEGGCDGDGDCESGDCESGVDSAFNGAPALRTSMGGAERRRRRRVETWKR